MKWEQLGKGLVSFLRAVLGFEREAMAEGKLFPIPLKFEDFLIQEL
jgi:hypothetical protein